MARSELGTLLARNHDEIDVLRWMGERDYVEFTVQGRIRPRRSAISRSSYANAPARSTKPMANAMAVQREHTRYYRPSYAGVARSRTYLPAFNSEYTIPTNRSALVPAPAGKSPPGTLAS